MKQIKEWLHNGKPTIDVCKSADGYHVDAYWLTKSKAVNFFTFDNKATALDVGQAYHNQYVRKQKG